MPTKSKQRATKVMVKQNPHLNWTYSAYYCQFQYRLRVHPTTPIHDVGMVGIESYNDNRLWLQRKDHPLLNDMVLKNLFGYLKPSDLKTIRLVCKKWTVESLPLARSTFRVTIRGKYPELDSHRVKDFVALFGSNDCLGIPFTEFNLEFFDLTFEACEKFIQLCGKLAKKIDLSSSLDVHSIGDVSELLRKTPNLEYFKLPWGLREVGHTSGENIFKLFPAHLEEKPSLKYLKTLDLGNVVERQYLMACPTFFDELLNEATNISTLFLSNVGDAMVLEILRSVENVGRESRIEILSLHHVKTDVLNAIQKMVAKPKGLKLKHLSLKYGFLSGMTWYALVESMKDTLVSLQIHEHLPIPSHFPRMPKLKLLDLEMKHVLGYTRVGKLQDFNDTFPALQYLKLDSENENSSLDEFFNGSECCPLIQSLSFGDSKVNLETYERTLNIFPNLKELELEITVDGADILQKIWTEMSGLEKLNIYGRLSTGTIDSLVTGFSDEEIEWITGMELIPLKDMTTEERRLTISKLIRGRRLPSIRNLTNLRHLTLNMTARMPGTVRLLYMSNWTGYFGFYTLKNLRHLSIADCKISETCSEILVADMELDSWKFRGLDGDHVIPPRWNSGNDGGDWSFPSSKFS